MESEIRRRIVALGLMTLVSLVMPSVAQADDDDNHSSESGSGNEQSDDDDDDDGESHHGSNSGSGTSGSSLTSIIKDGDDDDDDHDRARDAVRSGKAQPLQSLKHLLNTNYPGKILNVNMLKRRGDFYYVIRILDPQNSIVTVSLDAATLKPRKP